MSSDARNTVTRSAADATSVNTAGDDTAAPSATSPESDRPPFGPPANPSELGRLGKYRIQRELGRGGMGAVYLAFDERLQRKVALKVMLPKAAANATAKDRFLREARAAAQISSDHVVNIYEADEIDGVPFIALQYLQGYPLDEYLKKKGAPTVPQVIRLGRETALGLAAAHRLGLVHRDIKPGNVWLEAPSGRVKILDFGLAKPVVGKEQAELTASGAIVGTPAYMAPEQGLGKPLDGRADLFSLGVMLYRLTAGRLPFEGPTLMAILTAIATDDPPPVRTLNPQVHEPLADLIHRLLAKNPADRPASATEVVKALDGMSAATKKPAAVDPDAPTVSQPLVYTPMAVTVEPSNPFEHRADEEPSSAVEPAPKPAPKRGKTPPWPLIAAAAGFAFLLVAGLAGFIIIKITNKDGTVTEIKVPEGSKVEVSQDGKSLATVGADGKPSTPTPAALPPVKATAPGLVFDDKASYADVPKFKLQKGVPFTLEVLAAEADKQAGYQGTLANLTDKEQVVWLIRRGKSLIGLYWPVGEKVYHVGAVVPVRGDGRPVHVALTWDGTALGLFVDGSPPKAPDVGRIDPAGWVPPDRTRLTLAAEVVGDGDQAEVTHPFRGLVSGVRVSTGARYAAAFPPPVRFDADADTRALYRCDDGRGDVLTDSSGNKHHGKISGAKWVTAGGEPKK